MISTFVTVTPLLPTGPDFDGELRIYTEHMGFRITWQMDGMAGIERDGVSFNVQRNSTKAWLENASMSIGVRDVDALHAEYRNVPGRVGPLEMKVWGRREFHLVMTSGVCFQFYERAPT
jgi:hypothetical protein